MPIIFLKRPNAVINVALATQIIASSVFVGGFGDLRMPANAQTTPAPLQLSQASDPLTQQMLGQWQAKDPVSDQILTFIFASEDTLYIILPPREDTARAVEMRYKVDPTMKPMHLDVRLSEEEMVQTLFELTPDGKLRMQLVGTNPGSPRPAALGEDATVFDKVSSATEVPENAMVVEFTSQIKLAKESEGRQYIGAMNRAQQAYHIEMSKFATNLDELGIGIAPESENYRYEITPPGEGRVVMTATPTSDELKAYVGIVYVKEENGQMLTMSELCETHESSMTSPPVPTAPLDLTQESQCPTGTHSLNR